MASSLVSEPERWRSVWHRLQGRVFSVESKRASGSRTAASTKSRSSGTRRPSCSCPMPRRRAGDPDPPVSRRASDRELWELPAGSLEPGETPEDGGRPRMRRGDRPGARAARTRRRVLSRAGILRRGADFLSSLSELRTACARFDRASRTRTRTSTCRRSPIAEAQGDGRARRDRRSEDGVRVDAALRGNRRGSRRGTGRSHAPPCSAYD